MYPHEMYPSPVGRSSITSDSDEAFVLRSAWELENCYFWPLCHFYCRLWSEHGKGLAEDTALWQLQACLAAQQKDRLLANIKEFFSSKTGNWLCLPRVIQTGVNKL